MGRPTGSRNKISKKIERTCQKCGKVFFVNPYKLRTNRGKFCSVVCKQSFGHTEKTRKKMSANRIGKIPWNKGKDCPQLQASNSGHWRGGKTINKDGYVLAYSNGSNQGRGRNKRYLLEHRVVMKQHIGRDLYPHEVVHHINNVRTDNRIDNLMLFPNMNAHLAFHRPLKH